MSYTGSTTPVSSVDPSITMNEKRDVADKIRYLTQGLSSISSLIKGQIYDSKTGKVIEKPGLIEKESVDAIRYEHYTRQARPMRFTVTSGTEITSAGVVLTSVNGLQVRQSLYNPRNKTMCRVEVISTLTVTGQTVGSTTFSCEAGDELEAGPVEIEDNSSTSAPLNGSDDNGFNIIGYTRSGVSISEIAEALTPLAGGNRFAREKMYLMIEMLQRIDNGLVFSKKTTNSSTVNYTAGAQTGFTTGKFTTTDGLVALAGNSWDMGGFSLSALRHTLPNQINSVNDNEDMIGLCGNEFWGRVNEAVESETVKNYDVKSDGMLEKTGIKVVSLRTDGPTIKFIKLNCFNNKGSKNTFVVFQPSSVKYVFLKGQDIHPRTMIQDNKTLGKEDELVATYGLRTYDGGQSILHITNAFNI